MGSTPAAEELEPVVDAAARGDAAALRAVYDALSPRVCGYLRIRGAEDPEGLTQPSAEDEAIDRSGEGTALELLDLLPDDQRAVVLLRVLGELSVAETAAAVGRSEAAVRKVQAKALGALRGLAACEGRTTNEGARR